MQAESKGSFAVIRYNLRTYESGGVMAVIKGKESAESVLKQFEQSQKRFDALWRFTWVWLLVGGLISIGLLAGSVYVIYKVLIHFQII